MYVLVAGAGALGRQVARLVRAEGHDVVVIERDPDAVARAQAMDVLVIEGNASSPRVLERANVARADLLYAVTNSDEVNLMACSLARTRGVRTVARLNSLEYMDAPVTDAFKPIGAEAAVSIDMLGAIKLARLLSAPGFSNLEGFAEGRLLVAELLVPALSPAIDQALSELRLPPGVAAAAFERGGRLHFPEEEETLVEGDRLLLLVRDGVPLDRVARALLPIAAEIPLPPRRVLVAGATTMGVYLARLLDAERVHVRIVETDEARVRTATLELGNTLVVRGSATDRAFLEDENIAEFDAFVAATDAEEYNILSALIAKQLGVGRALAVVDQPAMTDLAERMGVDAAPSPQLDALATLHRYAHPLAPKGLALLRRGDAQILEVVVREGARAIGNGALKLRLPDGALVVAVTRGGRALFPGEEGEIREGDRVLLVARATAVRDLKRWF